MPDYYMRVVVRDLGINREITLSGIHGEMLGKAMELFATNIPRHKVDAILKAQFGGKIPNETIRNNIFDIAHVWDLREQAVEFGPWKRQEGARILGFWKDLPSGDGWVLNGEVYSRGEWKLYQPTYGTFSLQNYNQGLTFILNASDVENALQEATKKITTPIGDLYP